jgi:magnesium chelatase subunit H
LGSHRQRQKRSPLSVNIAELDRTEEEILSLPRIIANSIGRDIKELYQASDRGILEDVQLLQEITLATRTAVTALVQAQTDADGRVSKVSKLNFFNMGKKEPWIEALHQAGYPKVDPQALKPLFEYLEFCLQQIIADNELGGLY